MRQVRAGYVASQPQRRPGGCRRVRSGPPGISRETTPAGRTGAGELISQSRARIAACETSHGVRASSDVLVEGGPGGVFVVAGVGLQAAVEDADESVGELAECGVVVLSPVAELVVVAAGGW